MLSNSKLGSVLRCVFCPSGDSLCSGEKEDTLIFHSICSPYVVPGPASSASPGTC